MTARAPSDNVMSCQLPPIERRITEGRLPAGTFCNRGYAFQVFRQADPEFVAVLEDIRWARNTQRAVQTLVDKCARPLVAKNGVVPTKLYSRNADVDAVNAKELAKLPGAVATFTGTDDIQVNPELPKDLRQEAEQRLWRAEFWKDCQAAKTIDLKVGGQGFARGGRVG
ncbi:hypothetical protein MNEG_16074 [Monoraphidium neglectum]|uniref:Uncharacterized protein n=1 Tax=Monoraphidium neglectum TaxID=145388 RepID=A0A0D2LIQ2_9CHLO|nr:hypothetical protein MNEG_16074 [Monoraphidium neglectum]KIY91889.1 hypothetical protein MNEG_16074 [Monoraphidium neglectum]|eukprot:XP_013890909.1 hypothetical protein MNEG_16074 [Monoraphidium neglectum]